MPYFTSAGPKSGPSLWRDDRSPIDVLKHRGDQEPIGTARPVGCTEGGIMTWEITIRGRKVPGLWIVLGREFLPRHWNAAARPGALAMRRSDSAPSQIRHTS